MLKPRHKLYLLELSPAALFGPFDQFHFTIRDVPYVGHMRLFWRDIQNGEVFVENEMLRPERGTLRLSKVSEVFARIAGGSEIAIAEAQELLNDAVAAMEKLGIRSLRDNGVHMDWQNFSNSGGGVFYKEDRGVIARALAEKWHAMDEAEAIGAELGVSVDKPANKAKARRV